MKIKNIINIFLFYSIFGNIFERVVMYFLDKSYASGFMGSIFTPIYGIAVLIILFIHNRLNMKNKFLKIIVEFLIYILVLSLLEYIGGIMIENVFNKIFWNYDKYKYNLGKYVSLWTSLCWGLLSILILYLVHPLFKKIENHIPLFLTIIGNVIFFINLIFVLLVK